jgi:hypothetical protein
MEIHFQYTIVCRKTQTPKSRFAPAARGAEKMAAKRPRRVKNREKDSFAAKKQLKFGMYADGAHIAKSAEIRYTGKVLGAPRIARPFRPRRPMPGREHPFFAGGALPLPRETAHREGD